MLRTAFIYTVVLLLSSRALTLFNEESGALKSVFPTRQIRLVP